MCEECGCEEKEVIVERKVTEANDRIAHRTWHILMDKGILCINIMGAPGSGKTSFIEGLTRFIDPEEIAVIQGDLESDIDKRRLENIGIEAYQINTHSGCHLDAPMIDTAIKHMRLDGKGFLLIENVGNLVCPAGVKLGQHMDIVVSSTAEGGDKPEKYPLIFHHAGSVIISKYDLAGAVDFDESAFIEEIKKINKDIRFFKTAVCDKESFKDAADFLRHEKTSLSRILEKHHEHKH